MQVTRDDQQQLLGLFCHGPVKLLVITADDYRTTDTIERYLDGNGALSLITSNDRMTAWVAIMRERDCQHYVDRLASCGGVGTRLVDTLDEANEHIAEMMFA